MTNLSIVLPSLGQPDFLKLFFWSLKENSQHPYQVCIGICGKFPDIDTYGWDVRVVEADDSRIGYLTNRATELATGDWIHWTNDDVCYLPRWDSFDGRLRKDRALSLDHLEPIQGDFPPACMAGKTPDEFDYEIAKAEAERRYRNHTSPGHFLTFGIFDAEVFRSELWEEEWGSYSVENIDFHYRLYLRHPNLLFGQLGTWVYHFLRGSIDRHKHYESDPELSMQRFVQRHGIRIGEAYDRIRGRSAGRW